MNYCRCHPDRETVYKTRLCRDCFNENRREISKRQRDNKSSNSRDDINLPNLLSDAKKDGWTLENLHRRYKSYSKEYICKVLKQNNIDPKLKFRRPVIKKEQRKENRIEIPDLLEETATIRLNHEHYAYTY